MTVCTVMPLPPVLGVPTPPAPPPPAPAPAPTPAPAPLPGPSTTPAPAPALPSVFLDMANSKVVSAMGIQYTYNQVLASSGVVQSFGPSNSGPFQLNTVIQNPTSDIVQVQLQVSSNYDLGLIVPASPVSLNVPANSSITYANLLQDNSGRAGGTYEVTVSIGSNSFILPLGFTYVDSSGD